MTIGGTVQHLTRKTSLSGKVEYLIVNHAETEFE
jgi:hypothetical protein